MSTAPDTVVMIHGLWMTARSWERWADRYRAGGYKVVTEGWPGMDGDVEELRRDPGPIATLDIRQIVNHYDRIIRGLDRPPVIMGHSFGAAFTQVLLDRGLGAAGVAIDSAAVKGVMRLPISTLRSGWPILRNPLNRHRAVAINVKQFRYRFTNHLTVEASAPLHDRYCVPATGRVLFEGASANFNRRAATKVDFANHRRAPLLFIAGGIDHVSPPSINKSNARKYRKSRAVTEYKEFEGRSHFTLGQDGWEEVADFALSWAVEQAARAPRADTDRAARRPRGATA
jgi:pimeloyl-ACP methyl ester carboxylesterase